jgi:hypothetical protein
MQHQRNPRDLESGGVFLSPYPSNRVNALARKHWGGLRHSRSGLAAALDVDLAKVADLEAGFISRDTADDLANIFAVRRAYVLGVDETAAATETHCEFTEVVSALTGDLTILVEGYLCGELVRVWAVDPREYSEGE